MREGYRDDADVAEEDEDAVPVAHPHVLGGQLPLEYVDDLVLVLEHLDPVG